MARRVSLPAADDLFRPTQDHQQATEADDASKAQREAAPVSSNGSTRTRRPSGRVRHDEKMTVYVTADELLDIEHARLSLRRDHGLAVDRGRLVREAIAIVLAEMEQEGDGSSIVRRLSAS